MSITDGLYRLPLRDRIVRAVRYRLGLHAYHLYHWSDVKASLSGGPRAACYMCGKRAR